MDFSKKLIDIKKFNNSVLTIGSFDGMHIGHNKILSDLKKISQKHKIPSIVITFDPHPSMVLKSDASCKTLQGVNDKLSSINRCGIDFVWVIPFDRQFSKVTAKEFLYNYIIKYFNPSKIIIGYDHHFGFNREGDERFLKLHQDEFDYNLEIKKPILYKNKPISSSRIKSFLDNGDIQSANVCLGRKFELLGRVVKGEGLGVKLNFPTANIVSLNDDQFIPSNGVYCIEAIINNDHYDGMCNIGTRPTFYKNGPRVIEAHLFTNDLLSIYDQIIMLKFKKFLRNEQKYNNQNELLYQLEKDRQKCYI